MRTAIGPRVVVSRLRAHPSLNATRPGARARHLTNRNIRASFLRMQNGGKRGNFQRISEVECPKLVPTGQNLCSAINLLKN
jgi:hypothetical protein